VFLAIFALIPAIPHIVLGIEQMFGKGSGGTKKQAATSMLGDMLNITSQAAGEPGADSSAMAFIDDMIEATVKYFNDKGIMTHGGNNAAI
jgi:hypothetical protein